MVPIARPVKRTAHKPTTTQPPAQRLKCSRVHAAGPLSATPWPIPFGPLALGHRLSTAAAELLTPVRADRIPRMVPDDGGRAEGELVSTPEQPPAAVDIIARDAELRIEAAYQLERPLSKRHVAGRDVLSHRRLPTDIELVLADEQELPRAPASHSVPEVSPFQLLATPVAVRSPPDRFGVAVIAGPLERANPRSFLPNPFAAAQLPPCVLRVISERKTYGRLVSVSRQQTRNVAPCAADLAGCGGRRRAHASRPAHEWRDPESNRGHHDFQGPRSSPGSSGKACKAGRPRSGAPGGDTRGSP